jgi:hypothetical protein
LKDAGDTLELAENTSRETKLSVLLEKKCHEAENALAELSISNARDAEKSKWMVLEATICSCHLI